MIKKAEKRNSLFIHEHIVLIAAIIGVFVISVAGVLIVRAYLSAQSTSKVNPFGPMTYTNTEIVEDNGDTFSFDPDTLTPNGEGKYEVCVDKEAHVKNLAGKDKKPVFVRVAVRCSAYKDVTEQIDGQNKTYALNVTPENPFEVAYTFDSDNWFDGEDGYYYYKYIVIPGGVTDPLFATQESGSSAYTVKLTTPAKPAADVYYQIDISVDTVQAVATDSSKWIAADYTNEEVAKAWPGKTATITAVTGDAAETQVETAVAWS